MEYSKDAVETALKLNLQPPPDGKVLMQVLRRRILKERGFDVDNFTLEEVCIKLCFEIDSLRDQTINLQSQIDILKQKKMTRKQFVSFLVNKTKIFTSNQKKLLKGLSSCDPTRESEIITNMNIKGWTKDNLKALVKDTKKRVRHWNGDDIVQIKPLRGKPFNGYQLILNYPLLKTNSK